jgi:hypothetical protein
MTAEEAPSERIAGRVVARQGQDASAGLGPIADGATDNRSDRGPEGLSPSQPAGIGIWVELSLPSEAKCRGREGLRGSRAT